MESKSEGWRKYFLIIITVAFVLRATLSVIIILSFPGDKFDNYVDTRGYMLLAKNLLEGHGFSGSTSPPYAPDNFRTPGFPLVLALVYWLFDFQIAPFFFLNSLISAITCGMAFLILRQYLDQRVALLGGLLLAFDVDSIMYANFILTETLYTFVLIVAAYFFFEYLRTNRLWQLMASSIFLALNVYVRPAGIYTAAIVFIGMGIYCRFRAPFRWQRAALALVVFAALLAPWYLRNALQVGRFEISSISMSKALRYSTRVFITKEAQERGVTIREQLKDELYVDTNVKEWLAKNPDFELSGDGMPVSDIRQYEFLKLVTPRTKKLLWQNWKQVAFTHIYSSLGALFSTDWWGFNANILHTRLDMGHDVRSTLFWMVAGDFNKTLKAFFQHRGSTIMLLSFSWTILNYLFALWGFIYLWKGGRREVALVILLIAGYHVFICGVDALARYRVPILPYTMGLSAIGMWRLFKPQNKRILLPVEV